MCSYKNGFTKYATSNGHPASKVLLNVPTTYRRRMWRNARQLKWHTSAQHCAAHTLIHWPLNTQTQPLPLAHHHNWFSKLTQKNMFSYTVSLNSASKQPQVQNNSLHQSRRVTFFIFKELPDLFCMYVCFYTGIQSSYSKSCVVCFVCVFINRNSIFPSFVNGNCSPKLYFF